MYKDEMIQLHRLLVYFMRFLIDNGVSKTSFDEYVNIGISPYSRRTKAENKYAVFILAKCISSVLAKHTKNVPRSVIIRMGELAQRSKDKYT